MTKTLFGLPENVYFCKKCIISNQRPSSAIEFKHNIHSKKQTIAFDTDGICEACHVAKIKQQVDWKKREEELLKLLEKHRSGNDRFDCLVPGSGGKDSAYQAHILKYKYGMNPLCITWEPILPTVYGQENLKNWIKNGKFEHKLFRAPENILQKLTQLSVKNLFHPFQTFILGQKNLAPKVAATHGIELIFYGENEVEYGNSLAENSKSLREKAYYSLSHLDDIYLGGVSYKELKEQYGFSHKDLSHFLPIMESELEQKKIEVHYLGYFLKWTPQEAYYYAFENLGFTPRPCRSEGTYSRYNSIDDKIDDFHYYTTYIKFGIGRSTYDASQEIRNNHITRSEAVGLVHRFDGEKPKKYLNEVLNYLEMTEDEFEKLTDQFRSPHLWKKEFHKWKLKHLVY